MATSGPIPRFVQANGPANAFTITPCTCNLLFPFVTNQAGFDTGVAIANTSVDPYGTASQTGVVNLYYYGFTSGGGAPPPKAVSQPVPAGQELIFTLSDVGAHKLAEGYLAISLDYPTYGLRGTPGNTTSFGENMGH
jgi:hypothetical protein